MPVACTGHARAQSCLKIGLLAEVFQFTPIIIISEFQIKSTYFLQEQILDFLVFLVRFQGVKFIHSLNRNMQYTKCCC